MTKEEIDAFWDFVKRTSKEVDEWPAWKRNGSGLNLPARTCNRHVDCDVADRRSIIANQNKYRLASHCHDDCCEDCFGS